jgi:outer membrane immunogenic protein
MKKLTTCVVAITGFIGTSAFAADMAVKAPPAPPPAPVYNWTGWYVGVNVGASFGNAKTDFNAAPVTVVTNIGAGCQCFTIPGFAGSNTEYPSGFMGGGQIGYNWQLSPIWVVGLEADFQGAVEKDSNNFSNPFSFDAGIPAGNGKELLVPVTGTAFTEFDAKIDWFGTVRLRAGYVWGNGNVFSYVTGGLAYGKVDLEGTSTVSGTVGLGGLVFVSPFSITHAIGHSNVNTGWVVGYGTEGRLGNSNWTWKVEGLYIDLGSLDDTDSAPQVVSVSGGQVTTHTHFTDGILRGGLNYKFY